MWIINTNLANIFEKSTQLEVNFRIFAITYWLTGYMWSINDQSIKLTT